MQKRNQRLRLRVFNLVLIVLIVLVISGCTAIICNPAITINADLIEVSGSANSIIEPGIDCKF